MSNNKVLIALIAAGSALWWWPLIMEPNLAFSPWLPLILVALSTSLATVLSHGHWVGLVVAATLGTLAGLCAGFAIWWPTDGIADSYVGIAVTVVTLAAFLVSLLACLVTCKLAALDHERRRALWIALICCVASGPAALAATPALVARRVAHNDRAAAIRFDSLKTAVESTMAESRDAAQTCDGQALKRHYSGPSFSDADWGYITRNYVTKDGYSFMVFCNEKGGYAIDATPFKGEAYGKRRICTDETGKMGCGTAWNGSRNACMPCKQ